MMKVSLSAAALALILAGCGASTSTPPSPITFAGSGDRVGDAQPMAGQYRVDWTAKTTTVCEFLAEPVPVGAASTGTAILTLVSAPGSNGSDVWTLAAGSYALRVKGTDCDWSLTLSPLH